MARDESLFNFVPSPTGKHRLVMGKRTQGHILLIGGTGSGKCVHFKEGDFVVSHNGALNQIKDKPIAIASLNSELKLEESNVNEYHLRKVKRIIRLETSSGKNIELTPEHPLFTINGWKAIKNLSVGEFIATSRNYNLNNSKDMDVNLVKFLAYMIAEGDTTRRNRKSCSFTNKDSDLVSDFKLCCKNIFGKKVWLRNEGLAYHLVSRRRARKIRGGYCLSCSNKIRKAYPCREKIRTYCSLKCRYIYKRNFANEIMKRYGLIGVKSREKKIPDAIFLSNNNLISKFLSVLFSCEGCVEGYSKLNKYNTITICSKSEILIKQVSHLLLRFGILSRVKARLKYASNTINRIKRRYYILSIYDRESLFRFYKNINFVCRYKKKRMKILINYKRRTQSNTNTDIVPNIAPILKDLRKSHNLFQSSFSISRECYKEYENGHHNPSRENLKLILKKYHSMESKDSKLDLLFKLPESDIFWDSITSLKILKGNFKVYDMTIERNSNFIVNDIIVTIQSPPNR